jgi:hypothetical protein
MLATKAKASKLIERPWRRSCSSVKVRMGGSEMSTVAGMPETDARRGDVSRLNCVALGATLGKCLPNPVVGPSI